MTLADLLLAATTADTFPQEKFEGHGLLGFIILMAVVAILWGIFSERND